MNLAVQVEGCPLRIARVAGEADDVTGVHLAAVHRKGRERREVCVVEEISLAVAKPEPVSSDLVPSHGEDGAGSNCEEGRTERGEDVVAMVPAARDVAAQRTER